MPQLSIPGARVGGPPPGLDPQLDRVTAAVLAANRGGERLGDALRETYDQLYDGGRTGRYRWSQLRKTEKTHMGTLVEISVHRAFSFADGQLMDYEIAGAEVDCKFSQALGGWEFPPEAYEGRHLCLVLTADDEAGIWSAGLVRVADDGRLGRPNRDMKRQLLRPGLGSIRWLWKDAPLPENLLLHIAADVREAIFAAGGSRNSAQQRVNALFRLVQQRLVNRASLETVAHHQLDPAKRARDARLPKNLGREGILVLGHQNNDPAVAEALTLAVPRKGQWISGRIVPASDGDTAPSAEINGRRYRLAKNSDPVVPAPVMQRSRPRH